MICSIKKKSSIIVLGAGTNVENRKIGGCEENKFYWEGEEKGITGIKNIKELQVLNKRK